MNQNLCYSPIHGTSKMLGFFRLTCLFAKEKLGREKVSKPIWLACQLRYSVAGHVNKTVDTGLTILIASSTKL